MNRYIKVIGSFYPVPCVTVHKLINNSMRLNLLGNMYPDQRQQLTVIDAGDLKYDL